MNKIALSVKDLKKSYTEGVNSVEVLKGVTLSVNAGEVVAIVGTSGSGKSTLLQCIGGLDTYDGGSVVIDGEDIGKLSDKAKTALRNHKLGFVYQFHHLLPEFSALDNVAMPLRIRRVNVQEALEKSRDVLESMGLKDRVAHLPGQLSGGERQRVAIARAVVGNPVCLLADEPTGNLDQDTAQSVFDYLLTMAKKRGVAVVIVTHDRDLAARCDRILHLKSGLIQEMTSP